MEAVLKAILKTRCGCTKEIEIPRVDRYQQVYMMRPIVLGPQQPDQPYTADKRIFELWNIEGTGPDARVVYHETCNT